MFKFLVVTFSILGMAIMLPRCSERVYHTAFHFVGMDFSYLFLSCLAFGIFLFYKVNVK